VLDDDHVVFADINSLCTIENLGQNPQVSILVIDPPSRRGCRIWGKAEILRSGKLFDKISEEYAARNKKVNHVVKVTVDETQDSV